MDTPNAFNVDPNAVLLGEIVTWDMDSTEVGLDVVLNALDAAGLPRDAMQTLRPQTAFRRAVKDLREGRTIDKIVADKKSDIIRFQFTRKALDAYRDQIEFCYEAICELDTATGTITCPDSREIEIHADMTFKHAIAHRNTSDVTRLVQSLFEHHSDLYPINPKKGVAYFVPAPCKDFTAQVEQFLQQLGGRLLRFPVPKGTAEGNKAVKASVEEGLAALTLELDAAVDAWDEGTRTSTFDKAIERWKQISHKAEAYSEYLGDRQAALLTRLAEQKRRLAVKIENLTIAKQAKKGGQTAPLFTDPAVEELEMAAV